MKKAITILLGLLMALSITACKSISSTTVVTSEISKSESDIFGATESSEESEAVSSEEASSEAESSEETASSEASTSSEAKFTIDRSLLDWTADDWNAASDEEKLACCKAYTVYCMEIQGYDLSMYTDEILESAAEKVVSTVDGVFGVSGSMSLKEITDLYASSSSAE